MSAPENTTGAKPGPIDNRDVDEWTQRFTKVVDAPSAAIKSASPAGSQSWTSAFFACFEPIDLCLITCCVPCITFGKTHHRLRRDANLQGYEHVNTSCLLLCGTACVGLSCIPIAMQRADIREKFNLEGDCMTDLLRACCCACCDLMQQEKEVSQRAPLMSQGVKQEYQAPAGMSYPAPDGPAPAPVQQ